jgi:hypothetical protein
MAPEWLNTLAIIHCSASILCAVYVLLDILAFGHRQPMWIMDVVWPLTALYWGPLGLAFYWTVGRQPMDGKRMWQFTFGGATHCGAGCALGDFAAAWLVFAFALTVMASTLAAEYVLGFALAYLIGIVFQYFSVAPMRGLGVAEGLWTAIRIDTLSLAAYELGMFGFMGLRAWLLPDLHPTDWTYWFMMQIAMVLGFWTTYPVNWWLINRGTKERM